MSIFEFGAKAPGLIINIVLSKCQITFINQTQIICWIVNKWQLKSWLPQIKNHFFNDFLFGIPLKSQRKDMNYFHVWTEIVAPLK